MRRPQRHLVLAASGLLWAGACAVYETPTPGSNAAGGSASGGTLASGGNPMAPGATAGATQGEPSEPVGAGHAGDGGASGESGETSGGTAGAPETPVGGAAGAGGEPMGGAAGAGGEPMGGAAGAGGEPMGGAAGSAGESMGGAAGSAGESMGGAAGTGGVGAVGYRYVKLLAKSEYQGKVWTSVAELQVMTTGDLPINRAAWTITADSEETVPGAPAENVADGDANTYWHTYWQPPPNDANDAPLPHYLIVDLGGSFPITGFSMLPRQNSGNGRIKDWEFYVSADGSSWGAPIASGSFPNTIALQTIKL